MNFYSEHGEDHWLHEHGLLPRRGFYVDVGAAWPVDYSNTALLRDLGWKGIQVDGCDCYAPLWRERGLELIVQAVGSGARYRQNPQSPNLSKFDEGGEPVCAKTLNQILAENRVGEIDLLSVDVEGSEFDVVSALDFDRHQPTILIWEYNTLGVKDERLKPFLEQRGYNCVHQTLCNYIHFRYDPLRRPRTA